ncbi:MAG: tRNA (guanosine(46)-N7)-methyltransferase TrmB [Clostridia bacterium]|nr:tRNA (guanosine(46)-N7)-methyltransferase TrmB [Clostridia bacterium]
MRMRKKKNGEARLDACREFICEKPLLPMIDPSESYGMSGAPVYLEIGAGKGGFAVQMAERHGGVCYFAMEKVSDCVVLAAERAKAANGLSNLHFIIDGADELADWFAPGTVDGIFLNFSDPWSKKGYAKRRLTHRHYLALYMNLLKTGGKLRFKTDNVGLFDFSLEEIEAIGIKCDAVTRDLHASEHAEGNIMTEYETAFVEAGMKINMLELTKPEGFVIDMPPKRRRGALTDG